MPHRSRNQRHNVSTHSLLPRHLGTLARLLWTLATQQRLQEQWEGGTATLWLVYQHAATAQQLQWHAHRCLLHHAASNHQMEKQQKLHQYPHLHQGALS